MFLDGITFPNDRAPDELSFDSVVNVQDTILKSEAKVVLHEVMVQEHALNSVAVVQSHAINLIKENINPNIEVPMLINNFNIINVPININIPQPKIIIARDELTSIPMIMDR